MAAQEGQAGAVTALLEGGADVEARKDGGTALRVAAFQGQADVVKLLREAGGHAPSGGE